MTLLSVALAALAFACSTEEDSPITGGQGASNGATVPAESSGAAGGTTAPGSTSAGAADGGTTEGGASLAGGDQGEGDGSDVVAIGDSYMRMPNLVQQPGTEGVDLSLQQISGRPYRTFAYTGGALFPPTAVAVENGVIPGQFANALKGGAVKTVIATGGGNDLPQGGGPCKGATTADAINAECKTLIAGINEAIDELVAKMAADGVKDLVWVGYGPTDPSKGLEGAIAALRADRKAKCVANDPKLGLRCHYIDNVASNIPTRDGFHPTAEGYETIASNVYDRMKKEGARR